MPRDGLAYVQDMLEAIVRIREYTQGLDRNAFERDRRTVDAVLRNLEIIGEAPRVFHALSKSEHPKSSGGR